MSIEYLAFIVERSLDELDSQNKNKHIARYVRKRIVLGFTGFSQLVATGQVIKLKFNTNRDKIHTNSRNFFGGPRQNFSIRDTREGVYFLSLAKLMVLFVVIPVSYTGQAMPCDQLI